jgi:hypothetical protein
LCTGKHALLSVASYYPEPPSSQHGGQRNLETSVVKRLTGSSSGCCLFLACTLQASVTPPAIILYSCSATLSSISSKSRFEDRISANPAHVRAVEIRRVTRDAGGAEPTVLDVSYDSIQYRSRLDDPRCELLNPQARYGIFISEGRHFLARPESSISAPLGSLPWLRWFGSAFCMLILCFGLRA